MSPPLRPVPKEHQTPRCALTLGLSREHEIDRIPELLDLKRLLNNRGAAMVASQGADAVTGREYEGHAPVPQQIADRMAASTPRLMSRAAGSTLVSHAKSSGIFEPCRCRSYLVAAFLLPRCDSREKFTQGLVLDIAVSRYMSVAQKSGRGPQCPAGRSGAPWHLNLERLWLGDLV
jgi:hypothetical protein